jgi:hypothetical protein
LGAAVCFSRYRWQTTSREQPTSRAAGDVIAKGYLYPWRLVEYVLPTSFLLSRGQAFNPILSRGLPLCSAVLAGEGVPEPPRRSLDRILAS